MKTEKSFGNEHIYLSLLYFFHIKAKYNIYLFYPVSCFCCCTSVCVLSSLCLAPGLGDDGLLLVGRGVATDLHRDPLAAEDQRRGRGAVQGLQLLLCNK